MTSPSRYFVLGPMVGTPYTRYAVLHGESTVYEVLISRPAGVEVDRPAHLRWRHLDLAQHLAEVRVWTPPKWNERGPLNPERHNGEQVRTPVWRRAGRRVAPSA